MDPHRYHVGQIVQFIKVPQSSRLSGTPTGNFRIVNLLPEYQGNNQYRVESASDKHQRVVIESEIAAA